MTAKVVKGSVWTLAGQFAPLAASLIATPFIIKLLGPEQLNVLLGYATFADFGVTRPETTRFLLSLDKAVDTVFAAIRTGNRGETYVPQVPSAKMVDVAKALMGDKDLPIVFTGIRPGEKVHEIMVSEEECFRTEERGGFYAILPVLPIHEEGQTVLRDEYFSKDANLHVSAIRTLLGTAASEIAAFMAA